MSVLSFPNRGKWGQSSYRGNSSGHVAQHLFDMLRPHTFCDPMKGSGTFIEVAQERGIEAVGLDLHMGFDILSEPISSRFPKHWQGQCDFVFSHPPYHQMLFYSGPDGMWGDQPHPSDLSRCASVDEFLEKLAQGILNQRSATRTGGHYGFLLGDWRHKGEYHALSTDIQAYLPRRERRAVLIKVQHNCTSDAVDYGRLKYGKITHETVLIFERLAGDVYYALASAVNQQNEVLKGTWKAVVRHCITHLGKRRFTNQEMYEAVLKAAPERARNNDSFKGKIRQTLQRLPEIQGHGEGIWEIAA